MKTRPIRIQIKNKDLHLRNELHFEVQRNTRGVIFKDKTKYTRKTKHKNKEFSKDN